MMFKCFECGHLFEDGEQAVWEERHGLDTPPYEKWDGCPICKSGYEEVHQCKECDEWHTEDELYDGWCEKCLRETINYDTFFEYCEAHKKLQLLDTFVMDSLLGGMDCPDNVSWDFHQLMISVYKKKVEDTRQFGDQFGFLADCINFAIGDWDGRTHYAKWLNKREGSK